jgi:coenzyme F420 hydrogenase subunit beta
MAGSFADLKREVIDAGLCTRCGSCVGVCPEQAVRFEDPLGECLPVLSGECCQSGWCYISCPGKTVLWPELNQQVFGGPADNHLLGQYQSLAVGFAADSQVRQNGASGGVVSALSLYLLENRLVDGVISLVDSPQEPYRAIPHIIRNRSEVLAAAQSRYSISPVNTIFQELSVLEGSYAFVGLPCQVHSLRKLQAEGYSAAQRIRYVIGTYCGNILHFDSVRSFLARSGVRDLSRVTSLKYRAGDWPGKMQVCLDDGKVFELEKFYANYLIPFYIMKRCLLCTDLSNEFADISVGDGWSPAYDERGKGWSMVIGRTLAGAALLGSLQAEGQIELHPVTFEAAVNMHSHGLDLKKRGAFLRIDWSKRLGRPVPEYGYRLESASILRKAQEAVIDLIFWMCGKPPARWMIDRVPLTLVGRGFKLLRRVWIRSTRSTKRSGLLDTRFTETKQGDKV